MLYVGGWNVKIAIMHPKAIQLVDFEDAKDDVEYNI